MDVLLLGGTGFIGVGLARELDDRGHDVTALSREPGDDVPDGVETVAGDVTEYDSIEGAVEGRDAVVNLVSLSPLYDVPAERHDQVHRGGTQHAVDAAVEHDVDRFLQLSALDADSDGPTAYLRAKGAAERIVEDASVPAVIVRPSVVFGDGSEFVSFTKSTKRLFAPGLPIAPLPGGGSTRFQPIYREEFVAMIADAIEDDEHLGETYELGGPEVLTLAEVTRLVYRAEGKTMRVVPIPMPVAKLGITVMGAVPGFPFGRDQYRSLKLDNTLEHNDVEAFGVDPGEMTTFSEYLGLTP